jgi:eukaryotic-like serine/threonine-protein kinase
MAKDPADRPADAAAFVSELRTIAAGAFGQDWAERGRSRLAEAALLLAALWPSGALPATQATAVRQIRLPRSTQGSRKSGHRWHLRRLRLAMAATAATAVAVAAIVVVVVVTTGSSHSPSGAGAGGSPSPASASSQTRTPSPVLLEFMTWAGLTPRRQPRRGPISCSMGWPDTTTMRPVHTTTWLYPFTGGMPSGLTKCS